MPAMLHKGILGTKVGMTQIFRENGDVVPVTLIEAGPCTVVQRKEENPDGYRAIQLGYGRRREKRTTKPMKGHYKKAGTEPFRHLREVRLTKEDGEVPAVGTKITCDLFQAGDYVDVVGTMKGRGFSGVIKRHGFGSFGSAHGTHYFHRHAGSIGSRKPQHTLRGTRMAGQYGNTRITVHSLEVVRVDAEKNLLYVRGAVPGANRGLLLLRPAKKRPAKR